MTTHQPEASANKSLSPWERVDEGRVRVPPYQLEALARDSSTNTSDLALADLIDDLTSRLATGENVDLSAFLLQHSQHAERLRPLLPALQTLAQINNPSAGAPPHSDSPESRPPTPDSLPATLGDFRILRQIGRGGMGVVYEAEQISLQRKVAVKVLPLASTLDERALIRFRNEAQAVANLAHPHIVPIYGLHSERGVHFYSMQRIDGPSLDRLIEEMRVQGSGFRVQDGQSHTNPKRQRGSREANPREAEASAEPPASTLQFAIPNLQSSPPASSSFPSFTSVPSAASPIPPAQSAAQRCRRITELGIQAASALQYAHDRGIIHRDIKPANLLLDRQGKLWITDFGLARIATSDNLTLTGDLLGTFRYMSPEQVQGPAARADHRTDIYSLGATLYELLTGHPVISGHDRADFFRQITTASPRPPRQIDRLIPSDLETILLKSLAKDPADRYDCANDLADDLQRFLDHRPIRALPTSLWQKVRSWSRRHSGFLLIATASLAVVLLAISIATAFAIHAEGRTRNALDESKQSLQFARDREVEMRLALYAADIPAAQRAWLSGDLASMRFHLQRHIPTSPDELDRRGFEWHYFWRLCNHPPRINKAHERPIVALAFSSSGSQLATGDDHGRVKLWELPSLQAVDELPSHADGIRNLFFARNDSELITIGAEGKVLRWNAQTREPLGPLAGLSGQASAAAISADGRFLACSQADLRVCIWDLSTCSLRCVSQPLPAYIKSMVFSPEGEVLYLGDANGRIQALTMPSGAALPSTGMKPNRTESLLVTDVGPYLVCFGADSAAKLFHLPSYSYHGYEGLHNGPVSGGDKVPSLPALITGGHDGYLKLWELAGGQRSLQLRRVLPPFGTTARSVRISPSGRWLATGGADGSVFLSDLYLDGQTFCTLQRRMAERPAGSVLSLDGNLYVTVSTQGVVQIWNARSGAELSSFLTQLPVGEPWIDVTRDGRLLAVGNAEGGAQLWNVSVPNKPLPLVTCAELKSAQHFGLFSSDGSTLAFALPSSVAILDLKSGQVVKEFPIQNPIVGAFTPDERHFVAASLSGELAAWECATGTFVSRIPGDGERRMCLTLSPDGRTLAVGRLSGIDVFEFPALVPKTQLRGITWPTRVLRFTLDGRTLVGGASNVQLWNVATWHEVAQLNLLGHTASAIRVSSDGRSLVIAGYPGQITTFSLDDTARSQVVSKP